MQRLGDVSFARVSGVPVAEVRGELDLSGVTYLDYIRTILEIARLEEKVPVHRAVGDAVAAFGGR